MQTQANGKEGLGQRIKAQLLGYVSKGVAFLKHRGGDEPQASELFRPDKARSENDFLPADGLHVGRVANL